MPFARLKLTALPLLLALAVGIAGCGWEGEGEEVAAAILATSEVETRAFKGSLKMTVEGSKNHPHDVTEMTFDGAIDSRDDANPKMVVNMTSGSDTTSLVLPGDGKFYLKSGGTSYVMPMPGGDAKKATVNPTAIYAALGEAVGDFQTSDPLTNAEGESVLTRTAAVSRKKLCSDVIEAFGNSLAQASGLGGQLAAGNAGGGSEQFKKMCSSMVKSDPRVWFGLDAGRLTDVVLSARLSVPLAGPMTVELAYHEYNQDGEQSGIEAPSGAVPMPSLDQLVGAAAS